MVFAFAPSVRLAGFAFSLIEGFDVFVLIRLAGRDAVVNFFVLGLITPAPFAFVAFRAGAFVAGERLAISFGRADLLDNARLFVVDVTTPRRELGPGNDRLTPFILGSLMRCSKLSKKVTQSEEELPCKLGEA